jgi:hypothetical protein
VARIEAFYRGYLDNRGKRTAGLPFSESLDALLRRDEETCKAKAGTDQCGWNAGGDLYLNAQEIDPLLKFANSSFTIAEPSPGTVDVSFNVYPSLKKQKAYYDRSIRYQLIEEGGKWVVDDMILGKDSLRRQVEREIKSLGER